MRLRNAVPADLPVIADFLDWDEPSIAFYQQQGARSVPGWTRYRWTRSR
jgi:hypothetical protein